MPETPDPVELVRVAARFYRSEGHRLNLVRERWDLSGTQFYQLVVAAIDDPAVAVEVPMEVARLRRLRSARMRQKTAVRRAG